MLSKTKGEDRDRERGEGERGKETRALISLKKGWYTFNDWRKEKKEEKKNKTKYNNNNKTPPSLKKTKWKNANKQTLQMYLDPI